MGYGRTAAADGRVFKWTFNFPTTYWNQASAFIKHIADEEGGMDALSDLEIGLIYHNSAYGKEPIPTLETLAEEHGYTLNKYAVDPPGQEQSSTWLQVRRDRPDWLIMWGWGVMNQVAIKEAANIRFDMDKFIGVWWAGSEPDVAPNPDAAKGYKAGNFNGVGTDYPVLQDIVEYVYDGDMEAAKEAGLGSVLYNRGVVNMIYDTEAIRTAMGKYGDKPIGGEEVRWGFEHLDLTAERIEELGAKGLLRPIQITCANHEGDGPVFIQQWTGDSWEQVTDWIEPITDVTRPKVEAAAEAYAKENDLPIRDCAQES
jgi:branched-chain amino acid transport system substrate-binding protein